MLTCKLIVTDTNAAAISTGSRGFGCARAHWPYALADVFMRCDRRSGFLRQLLQGYGAIGKN